MGSTLTSEFGEQPPEFHDMGSTLTSEFVTTGNLSPMIVESRRNRSVQEDEPAVQKAKGANKETSGRTTRSSSIAVTVISPVAVENKRKTQGVQSDEDFSQVLEVPVKDAPVLGGLSSRAAQGKNNVVFKKTLMHSLQEDADKHVSWLHLHVHGLLTAIVLSND